MGSVWLVQLYNEILLLSVLGWFGFWKKKRKFGLKLMLVLGFVWLLRSVGKINEKGKSDFKVNEELGLVKLNN